MVLCLLDTTLLLLPPLPPLLLPLTGTNRPRDKTGCCWIQVPRRCRAMLVPVQTGGSSVGLVLRLLPEPPPPHRTTTTTAVWIIIIITATD